MRRFFGFTAALGLLLLSATSAAIVAPEPTCNFPNPSFGVRLDEDARAMGALDGIYVDGAVAVPIRLGLGMANIQKPSELVERGLVNMDVVSSEGEALTGTLELGLPNISIAGVGQQAWLIWVGDEPFQPGQSYELQYSFVNEKLSDCPEATSLSGVVPFTTGTRSAAEDLGMLKFDSTLLQPQVQVTPGCCTAAEASPCLEEGKCVACWDWIYLVASAQAHVSPEPPPSYFTVDFSLFAGDVPQALVESTSIYGSFSVTDHAPEYCFHAELRPRAHLEDSVPISQCVPSASILELGLPLAVTPIYQSDCAEPPQAGVRDGLRQAMFGATEQEARAALEALHPDPPLPMAMPPVSMPPASSQPAESGGCAVAASQPSLQIMPWIVGLVLLARRRRRSIFRSGAASAVRL